MALFDDLPDAPAGALFDDLPDSKTEKFTGQPMSGRGAPLKRAKRRESVLETLPAAEVAPFDFGAASRLSRQLDDARATRRPVQQVMTEAPVYAPRTNAQSVGDTIVGLTQGAVGLTKGMFDNFGENPVSSFYASALKAGDRLKSDALRDQQIKRDARVQTAQSLGESAGAKAAIATLFDLPAAGADVVARGAGSLIPTVAMAAAGAPANLVAGVAAASNAGDARAEAVQRLMAVPESVWATDPTYAQARAKGLSHEEVAGNMAAMKAIPAQVLGALTGFLSGRTGAERLFAGGTNTVRGRLGRAGAELFTEQAETVAPMLAAGSAVTGVDPTANPFSGLGAASVDTAAGTFPGAAMAAAGRARPEQRESATGLNRTPVELVRDIMLARDLSGMPAAPYTPAAPMIDRANTARAVPRETVTQPQVPKAALLSLGFDPAVVNALPDVMVADARGNVQPQDPAQTAQAQTVAQRDAEIGLTPDVRAAQETRAQRGGLFDDIPEAKPEPDLLRLLRAAGWRPAAEGNNPNPDPEVVQGLSSDFERAYQQDVKDGIKQRMGLVKPEERAEPKPASYAESPMIRQLAASGGVNIDERADLGTDPNRATRGRIMPNPYNVGGKPLFRRGGLAGDKLVESLVSSGYLSQAQVDEADAGGVGGSDQLAYELIRQELENPGSVRPIDMQSDAMAERAAARRSADLLDRAGRLGFDPKGLDDDQLAAALDRVERRQAQAGKPTFEERKADRVQGAEEARAEREAIRAQDIAENQETEDILDVLAADTGSNVDTETFMRAMGFDEQEIAEYVAREGTQSEVRQRNGEAPEGRAPEDSASGPVDQGQEQKGEGSAGPADPALTSYTPDEVVRRDEQRQTADKQETDQRRADDQRAQADAQRDDFTLTGSDRPADVAEARGQKRMFSRSKPSRPFYSALQNSIEAVNAKAAPAEGWAQTIDGLVKAGKAKADEVEWSGITDWLKLQTGKVTKEQVLDYLDANGVQVEEVVLGSDGGRSARLIRQQNNPQIEEINDQWHITGDDGGIIESFDSEEDAERAMDTAIGGINGETKYSSYQLPGGENYREVLLTLPVKESRRPDDVALEMFGRRMGNLAYGDQEKVRAKFKEGVYRSSHWDQPNVLAHLRLNDRTDADGKRVLFVEEIQSDWGQEGKKKGFGGGAHKAGDKFTVTRNGEPRTVTAMRETVNGLTLVEDESGSRFNVGSSEGVPSAPFVTATDKWLTLALKRVITMAAQEGYDRVAFINGEQSAERYDLSKQVDYIDYRKRGDDSYDVAVIATDGRTEVFAENGIGLSRIEDVVGKEVAQKIADGVGQKGRGSDVVTLRGLDLKVGGEGMKAFYDTIVPNTLKALLKKVGGGSLETVKLPSESAFDKFDGIQNGAVVWTFESRYAAEKWSQAEPGRSFRPASADGLTQPGFTITPAMREKVAGGLPLFSRNQSAAVNSAAAIRAVLQKRFGKLVDRLEARGTLKFWDSIEDFNGQASEQVEGVAQGLWDGKTAHLFGDGLPVGDEIGVFLHEVGEHASMEQMLGPKRYTDLIQRAYALIDAGDKTALAAEARIPEDTPEEDYDSELLAYMIEEVANGSSKPASMSAAARKWLADLLAAIRAWWSQTKFNKMLDRYGQGIELTPDDIAALAVRAVRWAADGGMGGQGMQASRPVADQTETPAFKAWFGDSKVVDADGKPLVVYHGTDANITEFKVSERGTYGGGIYLTPDTKGASDYAIYRGQQSPTVYPLYASIKNPATGAEAARIASWRGEENARAELIARGYDGVIDMRSGEIVAFYPEQIKSATGNRGTFDPNNADIRFSRPRNKAQQAAAPWHVPEPGRLDDLIRYLQDNRIDIRRTVDTIKQHGSSIADDANPYLRDELYIGRVRDALDRLADDSITPMLRAIANSGIEIDDVNRYLWARHAEERNRQMAKVNGVAFTPALDLAGMSTADAQAELAKFSNSPDFAKLQRIAKMVDGITQDARNTIVNEGLEDAATIKAWEGAYKHYVPLQRDVSESGRKSGGYTVRGDESRRAVGSKAEAVNILANVVAQAEGAIIRAEKAKVGRSVLKLAERNPNPDFWTVDTPPTERSIDPRTGVVTTRVKPNFMADENTFVVKENGVERYVVFNESNPRAVKFARNLKNLDAAEIGMFTEAVSKGTRYLSQWVTSRNPLFWATNFVRDVQGVAFNLQSTPLAGQAPAVMAKVPSALYGAAQAELGKAGGTWAAHAREFSEAGGKTGFMQTYADSAERMGEIGKEVARMRQSAIDPRKMGRALLDVIDGANNIIENGVRLAVYVQAREEGLSRDQAASIAKNISVNFNRKGNATSAINGFYMFANASLQGNVRMLNAVATSRRAQAYAGAMVGAGAAMAALNWVLGGEDDESRRKRYQLIPEWERERNWILFVPGTDKYIKVPLPLGPHVLFNAGRVLSELALDKNATATDAAGSLASSFFGAFNPIGGGLPSKDATGVAQLLTPSLVRPVVDTVVNQNFAGTPIAREKQKGGYEPPAYARSRDSTPDHWKATAKALNDWTGGDNVKAGKVNLTAEQLAYLVKGYVMPGIAQTVDKSAGMATGRKEVRAVDMPLVSKFAGQVDENNRARAAYDTARKDEQRMGEVKKYMAAGEREKALGVLKEWGGGDLATGRKLMAQAQSYDKVMTGLRKQQREVMRVTDEAQRNARLSKLDERIQRTQAVYLRNTKELRETADE